jgi:hydrogenase maturation protein HypF
MHLTNTPHCPTRGEHVRVLAEVRGIVQGVGFRPFAYRLAQELALTGWVKNSPGGSVLEVEGPRRTVDEFLQRMRRDCTPPCRIDAIEHSFATPAGYPSFEIRVSGSVGAPSVCVPPDLATCAACLGELFDPAARRYRYPFTNCTGCGPRFTVVESLPYDRGRTTMRGFTMCARCRAEYEDPGDRRFHAEPIACPDCGPQLELWDVAGRAVAARGEALRRAAEGIRSGRVIAIKGLGGFQLLCDARDGAAVGELRRRKGRDEKPFAVMVPDLATASEQCEVAATEERLLTSPEAPIVLLRRRGSGGLTAAVAPGNPSLGVVLPYTPLHHLLLVDLGFPVVATSGNRSDEPICTDEREALVRLAGIADAFLVHNRPIARHVDDSVVRVVLGREMVLRRARGYAPLPVAIGEPLPPLLATGAHLKSTVALSVGDGVCLSQHLGDLETPAALEAFRRAVADLPRIHDVRPVAVACDLHPDYPSTRHAQGMGRPVVAVQHHFAHVLACLADNGLSGPALGVAWDGTGHGTDDTSWGGEFLRVADSGFERVAHFRTFRLPGGDRAAREPRRAALGVLHALFGAEAFTGRLTPGAFSDPELRLLRSALERGVNAPATSSAGRLFDAVASLVGLRQFATFEGQAAAELEWVAEQVETDEAYPFTLDGRIIDWGPAVRALVADLGRSTSVGRIAARFHNTLIEIIVAVARKVGERRVALTGGCFQNVYLLTRAVARLRVEGFEPLWHRQVPPNDGGIALGQAVAAARAIREEASGCV